MPVPLKALADALSVPTQAGSPPLPALLLQVGIEGLEALKARDGNEKVPPDIAH